MDNYITNKTEFDYKLNIHAANMLVDGIKDYLKLIKHLYRVKLEDDDYCDMMLFTVKTEAQRLLVWMKGLEGTNAAYLTRIQRERLEELIGKIDRFRKRLMPR